MAGVVKVIELVGSSPTGWEDAVAAAVAQAHKTLKGLVGAEVISWTCSIGDDGKITDYKATVKVAFKVQSS